MFIAAHQKVLDDRSFFIQLPPAPPTQNENGTSSRSSKKQKYKHKGSPPPTRKKKRRKIEESLEEGELEEGEVEQVQNVSDEEVEDSVDDLVEVDCVEGDEVYFILFQSNVVDNPNLILRGNSCGLLKGFSHMWAF